MFNLVLWLGFWRISNFQHVFNFDHTTIDNEDYFYKNDPKKLRVEPEPTKKEE